MRHRLGWQLLGMRLRRRDGVALGRRPLESGRRGRGLRREARRQRGPPILHVRLHVRVGLRRRVGVLRAWLGWHARGHARGVLRVVDGRVGYVGESVHGRARGRPSRPWRADRLGHVGRHPPHVIPGARPRPHLRLRRVAALDRLGGVLLLLLLLLCGVLCEGHSVRDGRRRRRGVVPEMLERRLSLEVRRNHVDVHPVAVRGRAVALLIRPLVGAAVEV